MDSLAGRVIVLTGASRGIGRALALGLAARGANLVACATRSSAGALDALAAEIRASAAPGRAETRVADVTSPDDCEAIVALARKRFGAVHAVVNNAALGMDLIGARTVERRDFHNVPNEVWRRIVDVNVNGPFFMAKAAIPEFLRQGEGRIVNLSTSYDTMVREAFTPYGPTKAALEAMTVAWSRELAGTGILVNSVCPGFGVDTRMMPKEDFPDRALLLPPEVMLPPVAWLCSRESDGITGRRIVAKLWDPKLPAAEAYALSSARMSITDA